MSQDAAVSRAVQQEGPKNRWGLTGPVTGTERKRVVGLGATSQEASVRGT